MSAAMTPDDRSQFAAEYALGLLEGEQLDEARALLAGDPDFAAQAAQWAGRFAPLLDEVAPADPPARVLEAIEQNIGGTAHDASEGGRGAANVYQLRRRVNVWRGFTAAATALAASLALVLVTRPPAPDPVAPPAARPAPATSPMVAMMAAEDSAARLVATWDPGARSLVVAAAAGIAPVAGRSHELWVIPADGKPRSMGVLPGTAPMHLRLAGTMAEQLHEGATIAVSVEPAGGSPAGQPTGPVIAAGKLTRT